jgi:6-phospho-beta-glucosidase
MDNNNLDHTGWLNKSMSDDFEKYADFCYKTFGDRVKRWITFNEISSFTGLGYG